jgi:hypothetical protein
VHAHAEAVRSSRLSPTPTRDQAKTGSKARDEIYTYIAVRDLLLHDAEVTTTAESLRRAACANDFVENCLRPPRVPYEAQYLGEIDAARQREHCHEARARIAKLQQKLKLA